MPTNHPLRKIRALVRDVLGELNRSLGKLYASEGRPSIPPEQLLSALLLQVFYGIRSRHRQQHGLLVVRASTASLTIPPPYALRTFWRRICHFAIFAFVVNAR